jgi:DNA-directed RNA polymerase subunit RPC12/RpoP
MNTKRLADMTCPQCGKEFKLMWNDYTKVGIGGGFVPQTLIMRGCPSGGIYDVSIRCPHCDYVEEL